MSVDINTPEIEATEGTEDLYPEITDSNNEISESVNGLNDEHGTTINDSPNIDIKSLTTPTTLNVSTSTAYSTNANYSWGTGNTLISLVG